MQQVVVAGNLVDAVVVTQLLLNKLLLFSYLSFDCIYFTVSDTLISYFL